MNKKFYYGIACGIIVVGIISGSLIVNSKANKAADNLITTPPSTEAPADSAIPSETGELSTIDDLFNEIYHGESAYATSAKNFIGTQAKNFEFISSNDTHYTIEDMKGKPFILEFMTTSCETCQQVGPEIDLFKKASDIPVISVSYDEDRDMLNSASEKLSMDTSEIFNVAHDTDVVDLYNLEFVPTILYIDADGVIQFALVGSTDLETIQLVADTVLK